MKYADWVTKEEAARTLGVSERTVMRMADDKKIQQRLRPRAGGSPLAVFNPQDVDRVASQRLATQSKPFVMPNGSHGVETATPAVPPAVFAELLAQAFAKAMTQLLPAPANPPQAEQPVLLTIKEATQRGYGRRWLRERIKAGDLRRFGRKISRFELEALVQPQRKP